MSSPSRSEPGPRTDPADRPPVTAARLEVLGEVERALVLDRTALASMEAGQVADVGSLVPGKRGRGVRVAALFEQAGLKPDALHVHIASCDPRFAVSVPIDEVSTGIVVYELDGAALPASSGGPFRLLVPAHLDECVNVKALARLELARASGRDTRPKDDAEHARLHASRRKPH